MDTKKLVEVMQKQEEVLRFEHFDYADALDLGMLMVGEAKRNSLSVLIEITVNGFTMFRCALEGTDNHNAFWAGIKRNTVDMMRVSTLHVYGLLMEQNEDIGRDWRLDPMQFGDRGGGFPLFVNGIGVVGSVSVSGLPHVQDHDFVVDSLCKYLHLDVERFLEES